MVRLAPNSLTMATRDLGFELDGDTTRLVRQAHTGPLRLQNPLYPEHRSTCHAIIIHPLGDVVGGDELRMQVDAGLKSRVVLSTPGAA